MSGRDLALAIFGTFDLVVLSTLTWLLIVNRSVPLDMSDRRLRWRRYKGRDLSEVDFSRSDLRGASLVRAKLYASRFEESDLRGVDASGAYMTRASLAGAKTKNMSLRGAELTRAVLRGVDFTGADITGAYFDGAYLEGCKNLHLAIGYLSIAGRRPGDLPEGWRWVPGKLVPSWNTEIEGYFSGKIPEDLARVMLKEHGGERELVELERICRSLGKIRTDSPTGG